MVKRHNHYEAAFEDYLRAERIPYVAVNEQRRAIECKGSLKNLDFILSPDEGLRPNDFDSECYEWEDSKALDSCYDQSSYQTAACPTHRQWLIDVKGRRFPSGSQYWRNWTTRDELDSLDRWLHRFGEGFEAALVFSYQLVGDRSPVPLEQLHFFRNQAYAFVAVSLYDYWSAAKTLSPSWGTVSVPTAKFRQIARPLSQLLGARPMGQKPTLVSNS